MEACFVDGKLAVEQCLENMVRQHDMTFARLEGLGEDDLWQRPAPKEWSIGEIIDHARAHYESMLPVLERNWVLLRIVAALRQNLPYPMEIDLRERASRPLQATDGLWTGRLQPQSRTSLLRLKEDMACAHQKIIMFYREKPANLLGHVWMYDAEFGWINLVQGLHVNAYRDDLHYKAIENTLVKIRK